MTQDNWISVNTRLPMKKEYPVHVINSCCISNDRLVDLWKVWDIKKQGKEFVAFTDLFSKVSGVTHWQPLPPPPNK